MKKYYLCAFGGIFVGALLLIAGCATSELVDEWSDTSIQTPVLSKILVISVGKNPVQRRFWEDAYVGELVKHDVDATPSYHLFPNAVPDTNEVIQSVRSNGFDGILINRWLPPEANPQYMTGYMTTESGMRYDPHGEEFISYYKDIWHVGYVDSQKVDIRKIDVWATKKLSHIIWSARSESPEPNFVEVVRPEIVKLVMSKLTKCGFIASER